MRELAMMDGIMRSRSLNPKILQPQALACALVVALLSGGCVYRIDIQQGNSLEAKAVDQLAVGMTRTQVRYLMGTPLASTPFDSDRWDYVYYLKRGYESQPEERKLTVYFDSDKVSRIERPEVSVKPAVAPDASKAS